MRKRARDLFTFYMAELLCALANMCVCVMPYSFVCVMLFSCVWVYVCVMLFICVCVLCYIAVRGVKNNRYVSISVFSV